MPEGMPRFALMSWFCSKHAAIAWFGVVEMVVHDLVTVYFQSLFVAWEGRFFNLLGEARVRGSSMLPEVYGELWYFAALMLYWLIVPPMHSLFNNWYNLRCDQSIQRAYVANWPSTRVPEGAGQRLHEDVGCAIKANLKHGGLREAWMWSLHHVTRNMASLAVFFKQLVVLGAKFRPPWWLPGPTSVTHNWLPIFAVLVPTLGTMISFVLTRSMRRFNYDIQRLDASLRKAFIRAEDLIGAPVVEHLLRDIATQCFRLWTIASGYEAWSGVYEELPSLLLKSLLVPQIFSTEASAPSLGDVRMLESCFKRVSVDLSFLVYNMDVINYYRSVIQRLYEFELEAGYYTSSYTSFKSRAPSRATEVTRRHFSVPSDLRFSGSANHGLRTAGADVGGARLGEVSAAEKSRRATCAVDVALLGVIGTTMDDASTPCNEPAERGTASTSTPSTSLATPSSDGSNRHPRGAQGAALFIATPLLQRMRQRRRQLGSIKKKSGADLV